MQRVARTQPGLSATDRALSHIRSLFCWIICSRGITANCSEMFTAIRSFSDGMQMQVRPTSVEMSILSPANKNHTGKICGRARIQAKIQSMMLQVIYLIVPKNEDTTAQINVSSELQEDDANYAENVKANYLLFLSLIFYLPKTFPFFCNTCSFTNPAAKPTTILVLHYQHPPHPHGKRLHPLWEVQAVLSFKKNITTAVLICFAFFFANKWIMCPLASSYPSHSDCC